MAAMAQRLFAVRFLSCLPAPVAGNLAPSIQPLLPTRRGVTWFSTVSAISTESPTKSCITATEGARIRSSRDPSLARLGLSHPGRTALQLDEAAGDAGWKGY